jgi:hypothetical protein
MPNVPLQNLDEQQLKDLRVKTFQEFEDAKANNNPAAQAAAKQMLDAIDDALDDLSIVDLQTLANNLTQLQKKLDEAKKKTSVFGGGFGGGGGPSSQGDAAGGAGTSGTGAAAGGAGTSGAGTTSGTGPATPSGSQTVAGIDCALDCRKTAAAISAAKFQFVGRYYRTAKSKFPALSGDEARALSTAGLMVVALWESASDKIAHFSHSTGVDEGTSAFRQALLVGQPSGTPIYFAVDNDFNAQEIAGPIRDYFRGIADGFAAIANQTASYAIGVYGSGLVCSTLTQQGLAKFSWLAMSTKWSGFKTFKDWNIKQGEQTVDLGFDYDSDVAKPGFGAFRITA